MQAWAIKCVCGSCENWIGRATAPPLRHVSFPLLGVFGFVPENERLAFRNRAIAALLVLAFKFDNDSKGPFKIEEIEWPKDKLIGRLEG